MTSDEIRALLTRRVEAWARQDVQALMKDYEDECELVSPLFRIVRGRAAIEASFRELFRIFGSPTIRLDDVLIDHESGDRAAYTCRITAVHLGEVLGFPGTGRLLTISGVFMLRFANARISYERRLYDLTDVLLQVSSTKGPQQRS